MRCYGPQAAFSSAPSLEQLQTLAQSLLEIVSLHQQQSKEQDIKYYISKVKAMNYHVKQETEHELYSFFMRKLQDADEKKEEKKLAVLEIYLGMMMSALAGNENGVTTEIKKLETVDSGVREEVVKALVQKLQEKVAPVLV